MADPHAALSLAVAAVLAGVDAEVAARRPVCRASGRCCRFEEYGHRLYVTAAEMIHFKRTHVDVTNAAAPPAPPSDARAVSLPQFFEQAEPTGCPYQVGGLCTARDARPLGCRIYFCDENAQAWQNDVYETFHAQLRALHEQFLIPYQYLEWRAALRQMLPPNLQSA